MANNKRSILLIAGILCFLGGVVLMILGKMWGLLVILLGFALMAAYSALMFRAGGYSPDMVMFNGFGKGRQQSEANKMEYHPENPDSSIWDKLEGK